MRFWLALLAVTGIVVGSIAAVVAAVPSWTLAKRERAWGRPIAAGDILFQDLDCGARCEMIRAVTHSPYTHTGIVLDDNGQLMVWEAFGPVGPTPLAEWVRRGVGEKVAIYQLRPGLRRHLPSIAAEVRNLRGLPYDVDYQWDDANIYCSELVAKAVNRAVGHADFVARPVGDLGELAEPIFNLSDGKITPRTLMVTPRALVESDALERVVDELRPPAMLGQR